MIVLLALGGSGVVDAATGSAQGSVRLEEGRFEKTIQHHLALRYRLYLPPAYDEKEAR